ncbi:MAG: ATP-binding protein [Planctomycetota bacterium]|jgi:CO dehydrogenase maturation factor
MKIAVSGKGGVGKTTLSAMLAAALSLEGHTVVAVDADPDANLASALGLPPEKQPGFLADMEEFILERTGAKDAYGGYFKLNPKVDDIPEQFASKIGSINVLALGGVRHGGDGCICPATALIKALLTHLVLGRDDALVMDMDAGIEHLGRATTQSMDALLVVVDGGPWSLQTAHRVRSLAQDIGVTDLFAVANRVRESTDLDTLRESLDTIPLIGVVPYDERLLSGVVHVTDDNELQRTAALDDLLPCIDRTLQQLREMAPA